MAVEWGPVLYVWCAGRFRGSWRLPRPVAVVVATCAVAARDAAEMTRLQQRIDATSAWGLGIGIETHAGGHDLWHWGSNPGARSLMIVCPGSGDGVVVLTNGANGSEVMRSVAAKVLGRQGCWRPGCG